MLSLRPTPEGKNTTTSYMHHNHRPDPPERPHSLGRNYKLQFVASRDVITLEIISCKLNTKSHNNNYNNNDHDHCLQLSSSGQKHSGLLLRESRRDVGFSRPGEPELHQASE